jgi:hypothetical protein
MALWQTRGTRREVPPIPVCLPRWPEAQAFRGWTDDECVTGVVRSDERLSDLLNRRETLVLEQPRVSRIGVAGWPLPTGDVMHIDPFEFDLVLGGPMPLDTDGTRRARRIHKVSFPVELRGPNLQVRGLLHLFPGQAPEFAAHRTSCLFLPLTRPVAYRNGAMVSDRRVDVALVSRYAVQEIRQLDVLPN